MQLMLPLLGQHLAAWASYSRAFGVEAQRAGLQAVALAGLELVG
jgi:hypothetical protein